MPRCQWCRQESESADVCEWCKRPLTAGWTPAAAAAAGPAQAVALPGDRMTFVQNDDANKNDRILLYSVVGIILLTGLAVGISHLNKGDAPPPAAPPAVVAQQQPQVREVADSAPRPAAPPQTQESAPAQVQAPVIEQAPVQQQYVPQDQPENDLPFQKNQKMNVFKDVGRGY